MLKSVMIPIVKNKNNHITDKENYRPICLANVFTKVIENVLLSRLQNWLSTTCSQFGFKAKNGTEMCVFILKELIYTTKGDARVCVCVCVCLQNWTNFCPYGLNSTPIST